LSDDCTLRLWEVTNGACLMVMKFADPMTAACYYPEKKLLFVAGWDRAVRAIDLEKAKIVKHFVASKEAI